MILPDVAATVAERLVFNFAVPAEALRARLPGWLAPQRVKGSAVASFCVLDLRRLAAAHVPLVGARSALNAAWRLGALRGEEPVVFVEERLTGSLVGSTFTRLCPGFHPHVRFEQETTGEERHLRVERDGELVFDVSFIIDDAATSRLFPSAEDFGAFLRRGVSSYARARRPGSWNEVDLSKTEESYTPLRVLSVRAPFVESLGGRLDGGFATRGGRYVWKYRRLLDAAG